jgi:Trk K+ transport system NAD-binding subunit
VTVVHCVDPENAVYFERAGCDSVVCTAALAGQIAVQELQDPGVHAVLSELTSNTDGGQIYIAEVTRSLPTCGDLARAVAEFGGSLIGIRRGGKHLVAPPPQTPLEHGDRAVLVARERPAGL